jgi:hypothetical protein
MLPPRRAVVLVLVLVLVIIIVGILRQHLVAHEDQQVEDV